MTPITIKVGQSAEFDVPVSGEPPPTCVWHFNGKPIEPGDAKAKVGNELYRILEKTCVICQVDNEDYRTHLRINNATRAMAGKYTLKAVNTSGEDSADTEVIPYQVHSFNILVDYYTRQTNSSDGTTQCNRRLRRPLFARLANPTGRWRLSYRPLRD
jgi:hypothetical protein